MGGLDKLRAKLQKLAAAFALELPNRVGEIRGLAASARGDRAALDGLRVKSHSLKGTAGTFGYDAVSQAAAEIELQAMALLDAPVGGESAWRRLDEAVDVLAAKGAVVAAAPEGDAAP